MKLIKESGKKPFRNGAGFESLGTVWQRKSKKIQIVVKCQVKPEVCAHLTCWEGIFLLSP